MHWASQVAQLVKALTAMWEIWVRSLGWEDPLEKGKATHFSILSLLKLFFSYLDSGQTFPMNLSKFPSSSFKPACSLMPS